VAVIGQGYVGLPLAMAAAAAGHDVVGFDVDDERVARLRAGSSPVDDIADVELREALDSGRYRATGDATELADVSIYVICVPTPYKDDAPDLSHMIAAADAVAPSLRRGDLAILESTTYPGTTRDLLAPMLEQGSGLVAGEDFDVAFSPERIDPGNERFGIRNTPKVVGGLTNASTDAAVAFYETFIDHVVPVDTASTAEMVKLLENTFRHINIALANEFAVLCDELGLDVWQVVDAASTKPFGFMPFRPGPGVGGHCIPVDPMYLSWRMRQIGSSARFIELARDVNSRMPLYCVERVQALLNHERKALNGSRVLILGVAYKADVPDTRETPALPLIAGLRDRGAEVTYHDPHVPSLLLLDGSELGSVELTPEAIGAADCVIVVTGHGAIDHHLVAQHAHLVFDTRNVVPASERVHRL
jgi:nucleotide sugar dehydrogenase